MQALGIIALLPSHGRLPIHKVKCRGAALHHRHIQVPTLNNVCNNVLRLRLINVVQNTPKKFLEQQVLLTNFFVQEHIFFLFLEPRFLGGDLISETLSLGYRHTVLASGS